MRSIISAWLCLAIHASAMCLEIEKKPLDIPGAKIETEADAKALAFKSYAQRLNAAVLSNEKVRSMSIIKLGFDMPNFTKKGELLWEARISTLEDELRGIIWVHANTGEVYFVCGPWSSPTKAAASSASIEHKDERCLPARKDEKGKE